MQIGFIGLGKMGGLIVKRLLANGVKVYGYNRTKDVTDHLVEELNNESINGFTETSSINKLVKSLNTPRIIWMMIKAGDPVDSVINELLQEGITKGDIIVDGGNSYYKDSIRRFDLLKQKGINYLDVGTSGGIEGAYKGLSLMIGGDKNAYEKITPLCKVLARENGYGYVGKSGAGHFVKMIHNGVEYAMLEAIGEGFEMLHASKEYDINLLEVSKLWSNGSVVRGWLMDLTYKALSKNPTLNNIDGVIGGGETGSWTVKTAQEMNISIPAIKTALDQREQSKTKPRFSGKVIAALRNEFGGHTIIKK